MRICSWTHDLQRDGMSSQEALNNPSLPTLDPAPARSRRALDELCLSAALP